MPSRWLVDRKGFTDNDIEVSVSSGGGIESVVLSVEASLEHTC